MAWISSGVRSELSGRCGNRAAQIAGLFSRGAIDPGVRTWSSLRLDLGAASMIREGEVLGEMQSAQTKVGMGQGAHTRNLDTGEDVAKLIHLL